jgi:NosR/NirI family transcriptional regulator, nitrous oxide reductase regulator
MADAWCRAANCLAALLVALLVAAAGRAAEEAPPLADVREVLPGAEGVGGWEGEPPAAPVFVAGRLAGWALSTRAVVASVGYSGRPFDILVGIDLDGVVTGARLREHSEPVLVIGVSEEDVTRFVERFAGVHVGDVTRMRREAQIDSISGATVSSVMFGDAILRAARAVALARGILEPETAVEATLDLERFVPAGWAELQAAGLIGRLHLRHHDIDRAIAELGLEPAAGPVPRAPEDTFVDLYAVLATPAQTGRNLLGERTYPRLRQALGPGDHAILILARGLYSVKGTAHVRTGVFDRLQVVQADRTLRLTADRHTRIDALAPDDAPELRELGWFVLPAGSGFDPLRPWRLRLLVERPVEGGSVFLDFTLPMTAPEALLRRPDPAAVPGEGWLARLVAATGDPDGPHIISPGLWQDVWHERRGRIALLALLLGVLTLALVVQDGLARRPRLHDGFRLGFLAVTLVWLGWHAGAQLSVVNVLTFLHALLTGFSWELFLMEPLIFILWSYVAITLLFWGRGVFCGWLCPFGALQELGNRIARALRVPQLEPPFGLGERLWPIKYVVFLALLALSLHSVTAATLAAEVEPFKTAINFAFARTWPFVAYAVALLVIGLFVQRFFCRYLCPLGAALAIPARLSMFRWLKRRPQCGRECGICAVRCPVQAIHPTGEINLNECIYCLDCQVHYHDDHTCPPLIKRRKRREAFRTPGRAADRAADRG